MSQGKGHSHKELYGTYETKDAWVTPLGEHNIVHYDCPDEEEIKKRVTDAINEALEDSGFDDDCPLCALMKTEPYDIIYYCTKFCHQCEKTLRCKNFNPDSKQEEEDMDALM